MNKIKLEPNEKLSDDYIVESVVGSLKQVTETLKFFNWEVDKEYLHAFTFGVTAGLIALGVKQEDQRKIQLKIIKKLKETTNLEQL